MNGNLKVAQGRGRRSIRVTLAAIVGTFAMLFWSSGSVAQEQAPRGYTYDTSPVELRVSGHKFYVPRNDLFQYVHGQVEQSFSLYLIVPSLEGISAQNSQCFTNRMVCDKIVYIVISNLVLPPVSEQAEGLFRDDKTVTTLGPFGLRQYPNPSSSNYEDIYGIKLEDGQFYWIHCLKGSGHLDDCIYQENFAEGVSLRYQFRRTQLEHWKSLHTKLTDVLASFQKD
jgi:hypothetical protein